MRQIDHDARPVMTSLSMPPPPSRSPSAPCSSPHSTAAASRQHKTSAPASHTSSQYTNLAGQPARSPAVAAVTLVGRTICRGERPPFCKDNVLRLPSPTSTSISISFGQLEQGYEHTKQRGNHARTKGWIKYKQGL